MRPFLTYLGMGGTALSRSTPPRLARLLAMLVFCASAVLATAADPLRVGIDLDGEPMTFVDSKGVPSCFAVDIMNAIAREMGFSVVYVPKSWPLMLEDFKAGRTDVIANITYTEQRAMFMDFTAPHIVLN